MFVWRRGLATFGLALGVSACLVLAACAELPALKPDTCGNGVVEPHMGEDCDTAPAITTPDGAPQTACAKPGTPNECRHIAVPGTSVCPPGWGVGLDNVCSFASGAYAQGIPLNAGFAFFKVGDSNGDGHADVVGQTFTGNLEAWYGNGEGVFATRTVLTAGGLFGVPAFGSLSPEQVELPAGLDSDVSSKVDAVLPTVLGLFAVRSTESGLDPIAFPTFETPRQVGDQVLRASMIFTVDLATYVSAGAALLDLGSEIKIASLAGSAFSGPTLVPTAKRLEELVGRPLHANLDRVTPGASDASTRAREEVLLGFAGDDRIHVYQFDLAPGGDAETGPYAAVPRAPLVLPSGYVLARPDDQSPDPAVGPDPVHELVGGYVLFDDQGLITVDLDGDGDLDVLARAAPIGLGVGPIEVVTFLGDGDGGFVAGAGPDRRFDGLARPSPLCETLDKRTLTYSRWPLAAADVNGDGIVDLLGGGGIYEGVVVDPESHDPDRFCALTLDDVTWSEGVIGDFNRDGLSDVAAVSPFTREVDFRIGTPSGLFNRFRVSTNNLPTKLRRGDFDGDLIDDLALIENALDLETDPPKVSSSLSILFGDVAGAPDEAVGMGALDSVVSLDVGSSPFDPYVDAIDDLVVQTLPPIEGRTSGVAVMLGTSQRRMLSALGLSEAGPEERRFPVALQIGHFRGRDGTADPTPDIFALAITEGGELEAWLVEGEPMQATFSARHPFRVEDRGLSDTETFDATCASFTSADLGSGATATEVEPVAEIVAIDSGCAERDGQLRDVAADLVVFLIAEPEGPGRRPPLYSYPIVGIPSDLRNPRRPRIADVNADGMLDIVIAFSGLSDRPDSAGRGLVVLFKTSQGVPGEYRAEVVRELGPTGRPLDVALLNADADPSMEIAVLIKEAGVVLLDLDPATGAVVGSPGAVVIPRMSTSEFGSLEAADVDADGVADLLVSDIFQTHVNLAIPNSERGSVRTSTAGGAP